MVLQLPTEADNALALNKLLSRAFGSMQGEASFETRWSAWLSTFSLPKFKPSRQKKSKAKVMQQRLASAADQAHETFNHVAMASSLRFALLVLNSNMALKHDTLQFVASLLQDLRPLSLQAVARTQSRLLDDLQAYLIESIWRDSLTDGPTGFFSAIPVPEDKANPEDILDMFVGLVKVRGKLSCNLLLLQIVTSKPELLSAKTLAELCSITKCSHPWLRAEPGSGDSLVAAWKSSILPQLSEVIPDAAERNKQWRAVEQHLDAGKVDEAKALVTQLFADIDQVHGIAAAAAIVFPTAESIKQVHPASGAEQSAVVALAAKLSNGQQSSKLEACAAVLSLLDVLCARAVIPAVLTAADLQGPAVPHCVGSV
eukprot:1724317-Rhodomonas_salina.1